MTRTVLSRRRIVDFGLMHATLCRPVDHRDPTDSRQEDTVSVPTTSRPAPPPPVDPGRRLLDGLEALVHRHRALAHDTSASLHVELITAEVAQQLAVARTALRRPIA